MKTIGLIGGMSWESTVPYYSIINEAVRDRLGGLHSARIVIYSVDFDDIEKCQSSGDWAKSAAILADAAKKLELAGAELILIGANTMHKVFGEVQGAVSVPVIHIAEATADALEKGGVKKAALLGTKYTMHETFYTSVLDRRGFTVLIPGEADAALVNRVIYDELCCGVISEASRAEFARIIRTLKDRGAEAVIFGCTEIGLLVRKEDSVLPVYDTTVIHAERAAERALED